MPLRTATAADYLDIMRLYDQLDDCPGRHSEKLIDHQQFSDYLRRVSTWTGSGVWVAEDGEPSPSLIGTYSLIVIPLLVHGGRQIAVIESVVVDGQCRGQGIGAEMMRHAATQAAAAGCYKLMLSSNVRRTQAHQFYEQLGFERHGFSYLLPLPSVDGGAQSTFAEGALDQSH